RQGREDDEEAAAGVAGGRDEAGEAQGGEAGAGEDAEGVAEGPDAQERGVRRGGQRKAGPGGEEWAEERGAVQRQLARMALATPGPSNPDVIVTDGWAYVKLFKLTDDGKSHAAVRFQLVKGGTLLAARHEPEVVSHRPASVLEYLEWLAEKPGKWLLDEIGRATGVVPRGRSHRALRSYLAVIYQRDLA